MNDGKALLAAVCDHPDDDTHRLVYADWLEDNGDSDRAEFIRGQIELLRLDADDPRFVPLAARTVELEKANLRRWRRGVPKWARMEYDFLVRELMRHPDHYPDSAFHRGFPAVIECECAAWRKNAAKLLALAPIQAVNFEDAGEGMDVLVKSPFLDRLSAIHIGETGITTEDLEAFVELSALSNLRLLNVYLNDFTCIEIDILANAPHLAQLVEIDLWGNDFGTDGARALARSTTWRNLETLKISHNEIHDEGVKALAGSALLDSVRDLDLGGNNLTETGVRCLARSKHLGSLQQLYLGYNTIEPDGVVSLTDDADLRGLLHLDLEEKPVGQRGMEALAKALLPRLRNLTLGDCGINSKGAEALASATFSELRTLSLLGNPIGHVGVTALSRSPALTKLIDLNLGRCTVGDDGILSLIRSPILNNVRTLSLFSNGIGNVGARLLAEANLPNLTWLHLGDNQIGAEGALAIRQAPWLHQLEKIQLWENPLGRKGRSELKRILGERFHG